MGEGREEPALILKMKKRVEKEMTFNRSLSNFILFIGIKGCGIKVIHKTMVERAKCVKNDI